MKNTIHIDIYMSEVIYEVGNITHHKGESVDSADNHKPASDIQLDSKDDDSNLVLRCIGNAFAELKSRLSEYINEQGTTASNKLFTENSNVSVVLYVPTNFNLAVKESIAASMHQFMVSTSLREWYTIMTKDDAKEYQKQGDNCISLIIANINKRLRQSRGTLPNYGNDIKGGNWDALNHALVFTNDIGRELFSITIPNNSQVSNGYYDESTGVVHLMNPYQEDVFQINLSPLKRAAVDYSLQSIEVENDVIIFHFKNDKQDIELPVSDVITLPDMSNYYTKNETYNKTEVDGKISSLTRNAFVLVSTLPDASVSTLGKIYLKPKDNGYTGNYKDEYITINTGTDANPTYTWEKVGDTRINLDEYVRKEELEFDLLENGIPLSYLNESDEVLERSLRIVNVSSDSDFVTEGRNNVFEVNVGFGNYYVIDKVNLDGGVTINLPEVATQPDILRSIMVYFEVTEVNTIGFSTSDGIGYEYPDDFDFSEIGRYEIKISYNGLRWQITGTKFIMIL